MSMKIKTSTMTLIFIALYPIMPSYFEIVGIPVQYLLSLLYILFCIFLSRGYFSTKLSTLETLIFLWALWRSFTCVINGELATALWQFLTVVACYFVSHGIKDKDFFVKAIDIIIIVGVIVGVFGIIEAVTGFNVFEMLNTSGAELNYSTARFGLRRLLSFSSHTIQYCLYCMFVLALTLYRIANDVKKKGTYYIGYMIIFANAILSLSRGPILVMVISQLILLYTAGFKNFVKTIIKVVAVVAVLVIVVIFAFPQVASMLRQIVYMLLAVFNSSYASAISSSFGSNLSGVGNRLDLYGWVWENLSGHYIFGKGPWAVFEHVMSYNMWTGAIYKYSIEVNYLHTMYHYGIITMVLEILMMLKLMISGTSRKFKTRSETYEHRLSFGTMFAIMVFCYLISWFAVQAGSEFAVFLICMSLFLSYRKIISVKQ